MKPDLKTDDGIREALTAISDWGDPGSPPALDHLARPVAQLDHRPTTPRRVLATAAAVVLVAGLAVVVASRPAPQVVAAAQGSWVDMADGPLSPRQQPSALWSGGEMIVFGGYDRDGAPLTDGARYDPANDRWTPMAAPPRPIATVGPSAFVQGRAAYIVYPHAGDTDWELITYDPRADSWATAIVADLEQLPSDEVVPQVPVPTPSPEVLAAVGDRLVVIGWNSAANSYEWNEIDVIDGTWGEAELLPTSGDLYGASKQVAVSGQQVLFATDRFWDSFSPVWGHRIDVARGTVELIDHPPLSNEIWQHALGVSDGAFVAVGTITSPGGESRRAAHRLSDEGRWKEVVAPPDGWPIDSPAGQLVTTPVGALILGGLDLEGSIGGLTTDGGTAIAATPDVDRWQELPGPPIDLRRAGFAAVWTGTEVIVWGGATEDLGPQSALVNDGARYRLG